MLNAFIKYSDSSVGTVALNTIPNLRSDDLLLLASDACVLTVNCAEIQRWINIKSIRLGTHFSTQIQIYSYWGLLSIRRRLSHYIKLTTRHDIECIEVLKRQNGKPTCSRELHGQTIWYLIYESMCKCYLATSVQWHSSWSIEYLSIETNRIPTGQQDSLIGQ